MHIAVVTFKILMMQYFTITIRVDKPAVKAAADLRQPYYTNTFVSAPLLLIVSNFGFY